MQKFKLIGKPLLGEKYVEGKKKEKERKNNAKFRGHYVRQRTHTVRVHALHSNQLLQIIHIYKRNRKTNG